MKPLSLLAILIVSSLTASAYLTPGSQPGNTASAQGSSDIINLANVVQNLAIQKSHLLNYQEQEELRNLLGRASYLLQSAGAGNPYPNPTPSPVYPPSPNYPGSNGPYICKSDDNVLLDGNYQTVYDFSDRASCLKAIEQISRGLPFCDYNDNTLRRSDISFVYDFSTRADCDMGIDRVSMNRPFCDYNDNTLHRPDGTLIYDFSSRQDCTDAMNRY